MVFVRSFNDSSHHKYLKVVVPLIGIMLLSAIVAALGFRPSTTAEITNDFPAFVGNGTPSDCHNRCIPLTLQVARAELGFEPLFNGEVNDPSETLRALSSQALVAGRTSRCLSIPKLLSTIDDGTMRPAVLVHENGHLSL